VITTSGMEGVSSALVNLVPIKTNIGEHPWPMSERIQESDASKSFLVPGVFTDIPGWTYACFEF
jgi:hypothetical protein